MRYDLLIKNGKIIDGAGNKPGFEADIGIRNGKIKFIGKEKNDDAHRIIDARGMIVSPGFIDIQNHSDSYGSLFHNPSLESMLYQGITTVLVGQCGSSLAPLLKGSLDSIRKWTDISGINVNWLSVAEFFREIARNGLGVNLATLVGHATLRRDFVGNEARDLTAKEEGQIKKLYERSLKEGAMGISVGLEYSHDRPSDEKELIGLLKSTAASNKIASFHLRDEGKEIISAINEVVFLSQKAKARVKISHLKIKNEDNPAFTEQVLSVIENSTAKGADVYFDVYPYSVSTMVLYLLLPEWATGGGREDLLKKLKDPSLRGEIIKELESHSYEYSEITVASADIDRTLTGKTISEIAQNQNVKPEQVVLDLILASEDQITVFFNNQRDEAVETILKHPKAMIATDSSGWSEADSASGKLVHPRSFGTTARVLGYYVLEKRILSMESAVYKMSGMPAEFLRLKTKGLIKEGYDADIAVFDPQEIKDNSSYSYPYRYPAGMLYVLIDGNVVIDSGNFVEKRVGKILGVN